MRIVRHQRRTRIQKWCFRGIVLFFCVLLGTTLFFAEIRPLVIRYAVSYAETLFLTSADEAVIRVLDERNITYQDIIRLSRNAEGAVTSAETDIVKINTLKSSISKKLADLVASKEQYTLSIPLGAFFSYAYMGGWGPAISFPMQCTATARVNFSHEFKDAGINQVLHIVMVDLEITGSLIMLGSRENVRVNTSVFAAQTLIVGAVPEAFTNVIENGSDLAGTLNDYGAASP